MSVGNINQAAQWISRSDPVILTKEGKFIKGDWKERVRRFFNRDYEQARVSEIFKFSQEKLKNSKNGDMEKACQGLWKASVLKYQKSKKLRNIVQVAERELCKDRDDIGYQEKGNKQAIEKWVRNGHDEKIFRQFPEFAQFMFDTNLLSQMKVTKDGIEMIKGEPHLLVEGEWMKWSDVMETFEVHSSPRFHEKFVLRKSDQEVFTYLDNKKGLQLHHPYLSKKLTPISTLNEEEYNALHKVASKFVREGEEGLTKDELGERPFILQIVSSYVKGPDTNLHELAVKRKHPYLRIVIGKDNPELGTKKGEVYEAGFGWKNKPLIPFAVSSGQFRSPDLWEYMPCEERVVTNIPLSQKETHNLLEFTQKFHNKHINLGKDIGFHLTRQNCSAYVRNAAKAAGINVPTEIGLFEVINRTCPDWIKVVGRGIKEAKAETGKWARKITRIFPKWLKTPFVKLGKGIHYTASKVVEIFTAFILNPIRLFLGEGVGTKAAAFEEINGEKKVKPALWNPINLFDISSYRMNLPGVLQEWQRKQPSTQVFKKPVKLAIVQSE